MTVLRRVQNSWDGKRVFNDTECKENTEEAMNAYENVAGVFPALTIVATVADIISQFLDSFVSINRMDVTLKYTMTIAHA